MTVTSSSQEKSFFDLHITGSGLIRRVRNVKPKNGAPYLACDIAVSDGASGERSRFDCRVSGKDAQSLVRKYIEPIEAGQKVLVGFKLGDLRPEIFTYAKGERAGEQAIGLKARLLFIYWVTIDGKEVYQAAPKDPGDERPRHIPSATESGLSITGLGYLKRISEVKPKEGEAFLACNIAALNGRRDNVSYVYFDARVPGRETQERVRSCKQAVKDKKKVLIGFSLDGLSSSLYTRKQGEHAGEQAVSLKTALARLRWAKVDGEWVYKAETPEKPEPKPEPKPETKPETKPEEEIPTEIPETEPAEALAA